MYVITIKQVFTQMRYAQIKSARLLFIPNVTLKEILLEWYVF
jgi:hypothetical protein